MKGKEQSMTHRQRWIARPLSAALLVILIAGGAVAASSILDLGKPTTSVVSNANFPLSGFRRTKLALRSHGLPELLWIGTAWPGDGASNTERWSLTKALEQFGTLSGVTPATPVCGPPRNISLHRPDMVTPCSAPTFDWSHARFTSKYLVFVHKDLLDHDGMVFQRLTVVEQKVFDRYVRAAPGSGPLSVGQSVYNVLSPSEGSSHVFPLISVGGYLQTLSQVPLFGDFAPDSSFYVTQDHDYRQGFTVLPFTYLYSSYSISKVESALVSGTPPAPNSTMIADVNAEANVITALICHADGGKPANVCGRSVIKALLKHVK